MKLKLIEQYEELIECDPSEISYFWKGTTIVMYIISSVSSYVSAVLFHSFWYKVCGGNCFAWAETRLVTKISRLNISFLENKVENKSYDWTQDLDVNYQLYNYCKFFHFICLLSCGVAMIMLIMFTICGKGGFDTNLYYAPWRIVFPAIICNLIMMIITAIATHGFALGYLHFNNNLYRSVHQHVKMKADLNQYTLFCRIFEQFVKVHSISGFNSCKLYLIIQATAWTMTWSWITNFCILCLRVITSADFNLFKIKIYEMPNERPNRNSILMKLIPSSISYVSQIDNITINEDMQKEKAP